jgi:ABC-2 type transport system ATP-binding protein
VNAIDIAHLTKRYGAQLAVDDLSLDVAAGSVCGLLGPNGAGKSTTFKCLLALAQPTSGTIAVDGAAVTPKTFEYLAYVPELSALYENFTVGQHLEVTRRSFGTFDPARAAELAATFKLDSKKRIGKLSKGQRTAVALVLAFAIRPRVLVLDEPASGLDPIFQRAVLDLIIDAAAGGAAVLFSSHQIGQVERAADSIAVLRGGRLVLRGDIDTLKGDEKVVEAIFSSDAPSVNGLASDARVRRVERNGRILRLHVRSDADGVAREIQALDPRTVDVLDLTLEDIFLGAVSDDAVSGGA